MCDRARANPEYLRTAVETLGVLAVALRFQYHTTLSKYNDRLNYMLMYKRSLYLGSEWYIPGKRQLKSSLAHASLCTDHRVGSHQLSCG